MKLLLKKASSLFLAITIIFGMLPTLQDSIAYADDNTLSNPRKTKNETVWDCVYFGSYPQAEVRPEEVNVDQNSYWGTSGDLIVDNILYSKLSKTVDWDANNTTWIDGSKYKRINNEDATCNLGYYGYNIGEEYHYFKFEPIKWRVLNVSNNEALLLADRTLDCQRFVLTKQSEHGWEKSNMRSWLNNTFINTFSDKEKNAIVSKTLSNQYEYDEIKFGDTTDSIFLLSASDLENSNYGFSTEKEDKGRESVSTRYAKAMGLYTDFDSYYIYVRDDTCNWFTRSASGYVSIVNSAGGGLSKRGTLDYTHGQGQSITYGTRPSLCLNIASDAWSYAGTVSSTALEFYAETGRVQSSDIPLTYTDDYFETDASTYNNELSKVALLLSNNIEVGGREVRNTLVNMGFGILDLGNFNYKHISDHPGYIIGCKKVKDKYIFNMTIRGTDPNSTGDIMTDLKAFAGIDGFLTAGNNMAKALRETVQKWKRDTGVELTQDNTVLFITGHSLGGACAGQVARLCGDLTNDSNRYVYTFAAPQFDTQGDQKFDGVFNVCNVNDSVPLWNLGSYIRNPTHIKFWINKYSRIGTDKWCATDNKNSAFNSNMNRFYYNYNPYAQYGLDLQNHLPSTYMASLITEEPHGAAVSGKSVIESMYSFIYSFFCPVDIEVYDSKGNPVGMTVNGEAQNVGTSLVYIISQDGHKFALLPNDQEYTIKVIGDDTGTMQFVKQTINTENDEIVSEKTFDNVSIYDGKLMATNNNPTEIEETVKLYVVDEDGNAMKEVLTDGTEIEVEIIFGDINCDGFLTLVDVEVLCQALAQNALTDEQRKVADYNGDGLIDVNDAIDLRNAVD